MKQITKDLRVIKMRMALVKAREEYHSFIRVRELGDINSSNALTITMLRLEGNLVKTSNDLENAIKSKS